MADADTLGLNKLISAVPRNVREDRGAFVVARPRKSRTNSAFSLSRLRMTRRLNSTVVVSRSGTRSAANCRRTACAPSVARTTPA